MMTKISQGLVIPLNPQPRFPSRRILHSATLFPFDTVLSMSSPPQGVTDPPQGPRSTGSRVKSPSKSPSASPPRQNELIPADDDVDDDPDGDLDSSLGSDAESSTASVSASLLEYRQSQGRTYHSDKFASSYFFPNDDQQLESMDMTHHYLSLLLNDDLFLAPLKADKLQNVLDVGTGTGIWAIEFADRYPNAEVTGTDLSPCQPTWVPPNVRFEIDDATQPWTWNDNHFDFIHLRYLFGAIKDWGALFKEAYRCAAPGGWVQTVEADIEFRSDDDTIQLEPAFDTYHKLFREGGKALGSSFFVHEEQTKAFQEAGFEDVKIVDIKFPCGGWPKDPKLAEVGRFVQLTFENDVDGYTTMMWHDVLKWPKDEYQLFLMGLRKAVRNPKVHSYLVARYIYGRKPDHG